MPTTSGSRKQPSGVYLMLSTEFWERFSYYGFIGILVLFVSDSAASGGLGWSEADALKLFGIVMGLMWLAPTIGGWFADRYIGARNAVIFGCIALAVGNLFLASAGYVSSQSSADGSWMVRAVWAGEKDIAISSLFYLGIMIMIIGAGLFKSNASSLLGQLFTEDDPRRDRAFAIFYIGINLGALTAPLGAGTLGERAGWHFGFFASGIGMLVGLLVFWSLVDRLFPRRAVPGHGEAMRLRDAWKNQHVRFILLMSAFAVVFHVGLTMQSGLLNVYALNDVDRQLGSFNIPATWFLSLNPFYIVLLGPIIGGLWGLIGRNRTGGMLPLKMSIGLLLEAIAFAFMVGVEVLRGDGAAALWVLPVFYFLLTAGELCVMPAGLAEISRTAPAGTVGMLMGIWIFAFGFGGFISGYLGAYAQVAGVIIVFRSLVFVALIASACLAIIAARRRAAADSQLTAS